MTLKRWFTPFFGTEILMLLVFMVVCNMLGGPHPHTRDGFVLGYVMLGIMLLGIVSQLVSIPWRRTLARKQRVLWWVATSLYSMWTVPLLVGLIYSLL